MHYFARRHCLNIYTYILVNLCSKVPGGKLASNLNSMRWRQCQVARFDWIGYAVLAQVDLRENNI